MKYIADLLTLTRFIVALPILAAALMNAWSVAVVLFIVGILSDAFDGMAARRWPYTTKENQSMWWRKHPHELDNAADLLLMSGGLLGLCFSLLPFAWAVAVIVAVALLSLAFVLVITMIGKTQPKLAERVDIVHGWVFGAELATVLVIMTAQAVQHWVWVAAAYAAIAGPLLWVKRDRLTSRPEVTYGN